MSVASVERPVARAEVDFEDFTYRYYEGDAPALDGVSLQLRAGEFVLVCGASGSGKSSLLRALSGLVPHHFGGSASGEVSICGNDLRHNGAGPLAAVCGTVLQDPETQSVMDGVRAEIAFPLENLGWPAADVAAAVDETASRLGIEHLLSRRTDTLSGGELQRVVLAAALAARPRVLVLDEPTSQLDPEAADELLALLRTLCTESGTTVVLAEHRLGPALELADRVVLFDGGRVVIDASPSGFLEAAANDPGHAELLPSPGMAPARNGTPLGPPALRLSGVGHSYQEGTLEALRGIELELRAGERTALIGANGSGKSTLLRIAHGVLTPRQGNVERGGEVALLLQNPNDYLIHTRVADEAPAEALERFGLGELAERDPRDLSGGERQRLALAIVMQAEPAALLLDEPTRGMDAQLKGELAEMLEAISARGTAVMVATHDAEFAARFAQRTVMLDGGRVRDPMGGSADDRR